MGLKSMKILSVSNQNKQQAPSFSASTSFMSGAACELRNTFGVRRAQRKIERSFAGKNILIGKSFAPCGEPYYTATLRESSSSNGQAQGPVEVASQLGGDLNSFLIMLGQKLRKLG